MYFLTLPRILYLRNPIIHANRNGNLRSCPIRTLYATPGIKRAANELSQGHAASPGNLHSQDVQSQAVRKGKEARNDEKNEAIDAANETGKAGDQKKKPTKKGKGNPEGIGLVEQVGGASGTARKFEEEEEERK